MQAWIINWLRTVSWPAAFGVFLAENVLILLLVVAVGHWVGRRCVGRRVALAPEPLTAAELAAAGANVLLNTLTTLAGLWLWRAGVIRFRSDTGLRAALDVLVLLVGMDALMYLLHRVAHTRLLFAALHQFHHRFDRPRPLTLFALSPVENVAFGGLWLAFITVYHASWLGMSTYLFLNVLFGAVGHLGVEPCPPAWARRPVLRHLAGSSFHAQHHQDLRHNFGFYTLIWDRLFGTVRADYETDYGRVPRWLEE
ncbi:MAG TPA: sterol desaturase family protein [Pyrinomonadaceae bacterium]|jgi:sterol desaturase/sphingolipid hydroxylase (fatty acid hydroxylase superfamily)